MDQPPRKATDVLIDLEDKIDALLSIIRSQEQTQKILSNKLNAVMELLESKVNHVSNESVKQFSMSAVNVKNKTELDERNIEISADFNLKTELNPIGFRRTSRADTYAGDDAFLKKQSKPKIEKPKEITVPDVAFNKQENILIQDHLAKKPPTIPKNGVPIQQRIVDKNGKSIFLANVEIFNLSSNESVFKTRTNGTGKWMASLPIGKYKVIIEKRESVTKDKVKVEQEINVDGSSSLIELQMLIIK